MNRIKAFFTDETIDISNKRYLVFSAFTVLAVLVVFFSFIFIKGASPAVMIVAWIMFFAFVINMAYAVTRNTYYFPALLSCILANFVIFPYAFITDKMFFGAVSVWMVVGYTYTSLVLSKKTRVVVLFLQSFVNVACFLVAMNSNWSLVLAEYPDEARIMDDWIAVITGGALFFVMASFGRWLSSFEERIIKNQKENISSLYQNQNIFFSSMSHEIRTPINTIVGLNKVNLSKELSEEIFDYSTEIEHSSKKILNLINNILDMSKLQSGNMEISEVNYSLSDMVSFITDDVWKESYDKGLKLNINVNPNTPEKLFGDDIRIRQIVSNLLLNSINTTETGTVELNVRFDHLKSDEVNLIFEIKDTGEGIRREEIPFVFDTFRYVENKTTDMGGTGLELPIAKSLSGVMGGTISVDSIYRRGSTYRFAVPQKIVSGSEGIRVSDNTTNRADYSTFSASTTRVLVVDDDGMNLNVFKKMFSEVFSHIDTAISGEDAIALYSNNEYDLVFVDHMMPEMDGLETLARMKKVHGDIVAIALTANTGSEARGLYREVGFTDYLTKPIDKEYALRTIYKLLPKEKIDKKEELIVNQENIYTDSKEQQRTPFVITTDSVADIPEDILKQYSIPVIPFYVNTSEGRRYKDRIEIASNSLISFINDDNKYAFSEAPSESEYEIFFGEVLKQTDKVIHLSVAKNSSKGYKNARISAKSFANVEVIDSGNVSFGLGMMVVDAARLAASGAKEPEIKERILKDKEDIKFSFVIDKTGSMAATGRISMNFHRICSFFNIHPIIELRDSRMVIRSLKFGDIDKIRDNYYKKVCHNKKISDDFLVLLHTNFDNEILEKLKKELMDSIPTENFSALTPGAAIASNCGRGAFGICYRKRSR